MFSPNKIKDKLSMNLVVKVGDKASKLRLHNCRATRALDIQDVKESVNTSESNVLVIEKIRDDEKDDFESFISEFIKHEDNKVLYYIDSEDDYTTMGLADKFEHDIYFNDNIYIQLSFILGKDVVPKMNVNGLEEYNKTNSEAVLSEEDEYTSVEMNNTDVLYSDNIEITEDNDIIGIDEASQIKENSIVDDNHIDTSKASEYSENSGSNDKELEDKYNKTVEEIKKAYSRIESLEKVISNISKEKKTIEEKFRNIIISDSEVKVIERNTINIDDFNKLKESKQRLDEELTKINNELEETKNDNNNLNGIITNLKQDKTDLSADNEKLNAKIDELLAQIDGLKSDIEEVSYKNNELEAINKELTDDNKNTDDIKNELIDKKKIIGELSDENETLKSSLNQEIVYREKTDDLIRERTTVLIDVLTRIEELEKLNQQLTDMNSNYKDNVKELESNLKSIDTNESVSLKAQLDLVTEQRDSLTKQYNNLIAMTGSDEQGLKRMINRTEQIESMNEKLTNENKELNKTIEEVTTERDRAQLELRQFRAKFGGATANNNNNKIDYQPRSRIISLFGYGNTGVTTTAVSLAYKLYSTATVLVIDWDLINPNMNKWLGINQIPLCKVNCYTEKDIRSTSLGVFYSAGVDICRNNISSLTRTIQTTKGGRIDYFSGLYYNIDNAELVNANYNEFLKLLDSIGYDYIIIDFGKLNSDKSISNIIHSISDISYKTIVVADNDVADIGNFKIRLQLDKFNMSNLHWFVNKCSNRAETSIIANKIKGKVTYMMYEAEMIGKKKSFNELMSTRTKFNNELAIELLGL